MAEQQYDPNEWSTLESVDIMDPDFKGNGVRIRAYKKNTDQFPRIGIQELWTPADSQEVKTGKQVRLNVKNMKEFNDALHKIKEAVKQDMGK